MIYKYPFHLHAGELLVHGPETAIIRHIGPQDFDWFAWVEVDPTLPAGDIPLRVRGTGHALDGTEGRFIVTVIDGQFAWHVYEAKR